MSHVPNVDIQMLANLFRRAREKKGLTQEALGFELGLSIRTISRIERGKLRGVPFGRIFDICTFFKIKLIFHIPDDIEDFI